MGICLSAEQRESRQRSHEIDKQLEEDNKRLKQECKLLLLGMTKKPTMSVEYDGSNFKSKAVENLGNRP
jgi:hypothetical protein